MSNEMQNYAIISLNFGVISVIKPTYLSLTHVVSLTDTPPFTNLQITFVSPCWTALCNFSCKSFSLGLQDAMLV